ncbi:hypothetical protein [Salinibacter ruber]|uniref:Right handed beta helix domain-containing protein n=1 Tax=Salinibacter ruber TaxID=146919 RepID=A0A9X2UL95_9BACT|nr:hypothetical protein [Salinibacter ruber]MCS3611872.1 hypothetical protein [Salinibacter ruber]MCS3615436.1 hypothetical protein [Salinibacter ruber]MCS3646418.1 hypothetical protein [Salinibacter ruber]MCS3674593.1 hypothetical protein [Salinibacter ruber]MCS3784156.1 hypothetical protein [Salinibacter ruber]
MSLFDFDWCSYCVSSLLIVTKYGIQNPGLSAPTVLSGSVSAPRLRAGLLLLLLPLSAAAQSDPTVPIEKVGIFDGSNSFPPQSVVEVFEAPIKEGIREKTKMRQLDGGVLYRITEDVTLRDTLTIEAGVQMTFAEDVQLKVFGVEPAILANGTAGLPIRMTATEGNKMPGWWQGIYLRDDFGGTLSNVIIRHGGGASSPANITAEQILPDIGAQGSLTVENSRIEDSGKHGIACNDAGIDLTAQGNAFAGIPGKPITGCGTE